MIFTWKKLWNNILLAFLHVCLSSSKVDIAPCVKWRFCTNIFSNIYLQKMQIINHINDFWIAYFSMKPCLCYRLEKYVSLWIYFLWTTVIATNSTTDCINHIQIMQNLLYKDHIFCIMKKKKSIVYMISENSQKLELS